MTWAEILTTFNFVVWIMPILIRSYIAWKRPNDSRDYVSNPINKSVSDAISRLNIGSKKINFGNRREADREVQKGNKQ